MAVSQKILNSQQGSVNNNTIVSSKTLLWVWEERVAHVCPVLVISERHQPYDQIRPPATRQDYSAPQQSLLSFTVSQPHSLERVNIHSQLTCQWWLGSFIHSTNTKWLWIRACSRFWGYEDERNSLWFLEACFSVRKSHVKNNSRIVKKVPPNLFKESHRKLLKGGRVWALTSTEGRRTFWTMVCTEAPSYPRDIKCPTFCGSWSVCCPTRTACTVVRLDKATCRWQSKKQDPKKETGSYPKSNVLLCTLLQNLRGLFNLPPFQSPWSSTLWLSSDSDHVQRRFAQPAVAPQLPPTNQWLKFTHGRLTYSSSDERGVSGYYQTMLPPQWDLIIKNWQQCTSKGWASKQICDTKVSLLSLWPTPVGKGEIVKNQQLSSHTATGPLHN